MAGENKSQKEKLKMGRLEREKKALSLDSQLCHYLAG